MKTTLLASALALAALPAAAKDKVIPLAPADAVLLQGKTVAVTLHERSDFGAMTAGEDHMPTRLSVRERTLRRTDGGATSRTAALWSMKAFTVSKYARQSVWQLVRLSDFQLQSKADKAGSWKNS